jgi:hypothetical protein
VTPGKQSAKAHPSPPAKARRTRRQTADLRSEPIPPVGAIDFTMMYATHDAFRRDLRRLAALADQPRTARALAGWHNFTTQLLIHHSVEDDHLWPTVRSAVDGRTGGQDLLNDMEAEHALLEPLLDAVERAITQQGAALAEAVEKLSAALVGHLDHEERDGLSLIQAALTPADWRTFAGHMRRRQGVRGAATYVPWVLDGIPKAKQQQFLGALPPPVRLVNRLFWQRSYRLHRQF